MSTYRGVNTSLEQCLNSVLNVKVLEGAFNQEKALCENQSLNQCNGALHSTNFYISRPAVARQRAAPVLPLSFFPLSPRPGSSAPRSRAARRSAGLCTFRACVRVKVNFQLLGAIKLYDVSQSPVSPSSCLLYCLNQIPPPDL